MAMSCDSKMAARGFYDLNLLFNSNSPQSNQQLIHMAFKLGYDVVALNTVMEEPLSKYWGKETQIPKPPNLTELNKSFNEDPQLNFRPRKVLSRITLKISDSANIPKLMSKPILEYDILAVQPETLKAFQMACNTLNVDIICFEMVNRSDFNLFVFSLMKAAANRGILFEISYSPLFSNPTTLRNSLSTARRVTNYCNTKSVIFSSMASTPKEIRGPYDVANFAYLYGLKTDIKMPITVNCRAVVLKAESRKSAKGAIQVVNATPSETVPSEPIKAKKRKRKAESKD